MEIIALLHRCASTGTRGRKGNPRADGPGPSYQRAINGGRSSTTPELASRGPRRKAVEPGRERLCCQGGYPFRSSGCPAKDRRHVALLQRTGSKSRHEIFSVRQKSSRRRWGMCRGQRLRAGTGSDPSNSPRAGSGFTWNSSGIIAIANTIPRRSAFITHGPKFGERVSSSLSSWASRRLRRLMPQTLDFDLDVCLS